MISCFMSFTTFIKSYWDDERILMIPEFSLKKEGPLCEVKGSFNKKRQVLMVGAF